MTLSTPLQAFFLAQQWTGDMVTSIDNDDGSSSSSSEEKDQATPLVVVSLIQDNARVNLSRNPLAKLQRRRSRLLASRWNSGTTMDSTIDPTATDNSTKKPCYHRRGSPDDIDDALISALIDNCSKGEEENVQTCTSNTDSPPQKPWRKQSTETVKKQDQPPMSPSRKRDGYSWPCAFGYPTIEECPDLLHVERHQAPSAA